MAKIEFKGIVEYAQKLSRLSAQSETVIKKAVYDGAGVVADAIKSEMGSIPTDERHGTPSNPARGIKSLQKSGLIAGFGLSEMRNENGFIHTKAGFDGYNLLKTKKHPGGQPNVMIARSMESGTSFAKKIPIVRNAANASKAAAESAMDKKLDEEIKKIMD